MAYEFPEEVLTYLESKKYTWSNTTLIAEKHRIKVLLEAGFPDVTPDNLLAVLKPKYEPYSVYMLFVRASVLEKTLYETNKFGEFIKANPSTFRGIYLGRTYNPSGEDVIKILDTAYKHVPRVYNLLMLMGRAGLRKSEALRVKWIDIHETNETLTVRRGKGKKDRLVPFPSYLVKKLRKSQSEFICGEWKCADRAIRKVRDLCGIPFTPHALRASCLQIYSEILPPAELKEFAGHSSFATTLKYLVFDKKKVADKIEKLIKRSGING